MSHNNMSTFFSGTDTQTLLDEGKDQHHFVSLIVNNAGTYTAGITRKSVRHLTVNGTASYKSFEDREVETGAIEPTQFDSTVVEWFNLIIEKHEAQANLKKQLEDSFSSVIEVLNQYVPEESALKLRDNLISDMANSLLRSVDNERFKYIEDRLTEIKEKKKKKQWALTPGYTGNPYTAAYGTTVIPGTYKPSSSWVAPKTTSQRQTTLPFDKDPFEDFDDDFHWPQEVKKTPEAEKEKDQEAEKILKEALYQILTGGIDVPTTDYDAKKIAERTGYIYSSKFKTPEDFHRFADLVVDYIYESIDDKIAPISSDLVADCEMFFHSLIEELEKLPQNMYIKYYISQVQKMLV